MPRLTLRAKIFYLYDLYDLSIIAGIIGVGFAILFMPQSASSVPVDP